MQQIVNQYHVNLYFSVVFHEETKELVLLIINFITVYNQYMKDNSKSMHIVNVNCICNKLMTYFYISEKDDK
jgi:hypothetical protein